MSTSEKILDHIKRYPAKQCKDIAKSLNFKNETVGGVLRMLEEECRIYRKRTVEAGRVVFRWYGCNIENKFSPRNVLAMNWVPK